MKKFAFIYRGNTTGGTKRVIERLLIEYDKSNDNEWVLVTDKEECIGKYKNIQVKYLKGGSGLVNYFLWDYIKSFFFLIRNNFDGILYPKGSIPINHLLIKAKKIYIVHDLAYFVKEFNAYPFLDTLFMKRQMKFSCKFADKIIAISKFTKDDVVEKFSIKREKIKVVYEGVDESFKRVTEKKRVKDCFKRNQIETPFLFYSGSLSPRKNLLRVLKAFNKIKDDVPHSLVMTGRVSWGDTGIDDYVKKNNLESRVKILGFVSEEDLVTLYSTADLYLFPSLYEGFGLPILEAQACGCPVLTSNVTSMPEVVGDSGVIVNPYSVKDIQKGIESVVKDENFREDLVKKGFGNIKRFSWKRFAVEILDICYKITSYDK